MQLEGLGKQIKYYRKRKNMTSDKLAEVLGISPAYLRQIECGIKFPSLGLFIDIADSLQVSTDVLLCAELNRKEELMLDEVSGKLKDLPAKKKMAVSKVMNSLIDELEII